MKMSSEPGETWIGAGMVFTRIILNANSAQPRSPLPHQTKKLLAGDPGAVPHESDVAGGGVCGPRALVECTGKSVYPTKSGAGDELSDNPEGKGGDDGRGGDGEDAGPHDSLGDAPAHGGEASRRSYADDGAGDGMGGAHGDAVRGEKEERDGAGALSAESADRPELGDLGTHGTDNTPAAEISSQPHGRVGADDDPPLIRAPAFGELRLSEIATGEQRAGDDAHGFLRVIAAVANAVSGSGEELQFSEKLINGAGRGAMEDPRDGDHEREADNEADERRQHNKHKRRHPFFAESGKCTDDRPVELGLTDQNLPSGASDAGSGKAADEGVRRGGWKSPPPGEQVPDNGAGESRQDDVLRDLFGIDQAAADGLGDGGAEDEGGDKVEDRGPDDGPSRGKHAGGDDGSDAVGGVMKAVDEVEGKRDQDGDKNQQSAQVQGYLALCRFAPNRFESLFRGQYLPP